MIKVLLYLSLLFASGIAAGEGVASLDDNQLAQQFGFCEQGDGKKADCDDQEDPVTLDSPEIVEHSQLHTRNKLVLLSLNSSPNHYFIRAPPTSH